MTSHTVGNPDHSFAIVTPTFPPDLKQCELLAESLDRVAPNVRHYLIVDRSDRPFFAHLQRGQRRVIDSEEILGNWIWRMPSKKGYWLSLKAPPARGWIMQQIKKIGAIDVIPERTLVLCDSDIAFFRPFDRRDLLVDDKVGLLDVDFYSRDVCRWTTTARRLLGLVDRDAGYRNHVGYLICWNRETIKAMRQRIETTTGLNWKVALARTFSFSEYMLYGLFVREMLGYDRTDHAASTVPLVKLLFPSRLQNDADFPAFFENFNSRTIAVMVHSKDRLEPTQYRSYLARKWEAVG